MPLSRVETAKLITVLHAEGLAEGDGAPGVADSVGVSIAIERLITKIDRVVDYFLDSLDKSAVADPAAAKASVEGKAAAEGKKRGRPPKDKGEANSSQGAAESMFNEDVKQAQGNGVDTSFQPGTGNGADKGGGEAENDLFGEAGDSKGESISEEEMKALLKQYMAKFGAEGVGKLTTLLVTFGVKRFAELPQDKYAECAAKARAEMNAAS